MDLPKKATYLTENSRDIADIILEKYLSPLYRYLNENPSLIKTTPGILINREEMIFYFGKTHLAIEYVGPETIDSLKSSGRVMLKCYDYRDAKNFIEKIVGFDFDATSTVELLLPEVSENLVMPTNKGIDKLIELNWNFAGQDAYYTFNAGNFSIPEKRFCRHINSLYFDADENGLKTRHIKWIDFIPILYKDVDSEHESVSLELFHYNENRAKYDAHYSYPMPEKEDYVNSKLPQINRFIQLIGNNLTSEVTITKFLESNENRFILSMAFLAKQVYGQLKCEWQSEDKEPIKPDFFVLKPNGFADIVEFKLPHLKSRSITGKTNRETFSAELNSCISQTRVYSKYFEDPNNKVWFEKKYGFKVDNPRRIVVIGRRWDFDNDIWKDIVSEYRDVEILTYQDLIDGVSAQFYL